MIIKNKNIKRTNYKNKKTPTEINEIEEVRKKLIDVFGYAIADQISDIRFVVDGFHNKTYIAKYGDLWVQLRMPKNILNIDYANETKILKNFKDYLHVKEGHLIKKWFPGWDLFKLRIDQRVEYALFNCVKNFQKLNIKLPRFDWLSLGIKDKKYLNLVEKYKDEEYVLTHNNLKRHNVLINKYGFIKLIDFEFASYNSRYCDPVSLYLFFGISKDAVINFFNLDREKFDDYLYIIKMFNKYSYEKIYSKLRAPHKHINDSLMHYQSKDFSISNKFIIQKFHNNFDNKLNLDELKQFYFVPICVYEDKDRVIWQWIDSKSVEQLNMKHVKALARAMRIYHDSDAEFPEYILEEKVNWYLKNIDKKRLIEDFDKECIIKKILTWIKEIKPDANCHNNLNIENIYFDENFLLSIIDWAVAYRSSRFLDIAFMFENLGLNEKLQYRFWQAYNMKPPKDFYKYRIITHFTSYLYNQIINGDARLAGTNVKRVLELFKDHCSDEEE